MRGSFQAWVIEAAAAFFQKLTIYKPWGCGWDTTHSAPLLLCPKLEVFALQRGNLWGPPQAGALEPPACAPLLLCPKLELSAGGKLWGPPQAGAPDQALRAYAGSLTPRCFATLRVGSAGPSRLGPRACRLVF